MNVYTNATTTTGAARTHTQHLLKFIITRELLFTVLFRSNHSSIEHTAHIRNISFAAPNVTRTHSTKLMCLIGFYVDKKNDFSGKEPNGNALNPTAMIRLAWLSIHFHTICFDRATCQWQMELRMKRHKWVDIEQGTIDTAMASLSVWFDWKS